MSAEGTPPLIADWLVEFSAKGTRSTYRRAVEQFSAWHSGDLLEVTRRDVRRWVAHLVALELRDSTVRAKVSAISSFYRHLMAEGLIDSNPADSIRRPKGESEPRLGLTLDRARALIAAAEEHSHRAQALVWLMAGAGLRVDEACSARIEDLNGDLLTVTVKGGHRQHKPLSEPVAAAVAAAIGDRSTGPIVTNRDGAAMKPWSAEDLIAQLGHAAGIEEKVYPHILRHTAATLALEAGAPVEDVSALLGHRSIETTLRYIRNRDVLGGTRQAASRLGGALQGIDWNDPKGLGKDWAQYTPDEKEIPDAAQ